MGVCGIDGSMMGGGRGGVEKRLKGRREIEGKIAQSMILKSFHIMSIKSPNDTKRWEVREDSAYRD